MSPLVARSITALCASFVVMSCQDSPNEWSSIYTAVKSVLRMCWINSLLMTTLLVNTTAQDPSTTLVTVIMSSCNPLKILLPLHTISYTLTAILCPRATSPAMCASDDDHKTLESPKVLLVCRGITRPTCCRLVCQFPRFCFYCFTPQKILVLTCSLLFAQWSATTTSNHHCYDTFLATPSRGLEHTNAYAPKHHMHSVSPNLSHQGKFHDVFDYHTMHIETALKISADQYDAMDTKSTFRLESLPCRFNDEYLRERA